MHKTQAEYASLYALQRRVARLAALVDATSAAADSAQRRLNGDSPQADSLRSKLDRVLLALRGPTRASEWSWAQMPANLYLYELLGNLTSKISSEEMPTAARAAQLPALERYVMRLARDVRELSAALPAAQD